MMAPVIEPADLKKYSGMQRAGALMLALGETHGAPIWTQLSIDEVTDLSSCISELGRVPAAVVEHLLVQFSSEVAGMATLHGSYDSTERLLRAVMSEERAREIMENIRGPSGRTMWDKLSNVSETLLATYLKNEYPQTVAVILDKVRPDHAARVLAELPEDLSADVVMRMLRMARGRKRMMAAVPTASVVVTNPTHYAVALKYEHGVMAAPIVVAKGMNAVALRIREIAAETHVPVVESPPLARALHASADVDRPIPVEHYAAVAEVISYVMRLSRRLN
jgi:type III secretion system FlhB-like substrate exporter